MPRGSKQKYTQKQRRQAEHIEEGYIDKGVSRKEAEERAWRTVNAIHHGGEKPGGGGYGKRDDKSVYRRAGRRGGRAAAKKAARTRRKKS